MPEFKKQLNLCPRQREYFDNLRGPSHMMEMLVDCLRSTTISHYASNKRRLIKKLATSGSYYDELKARRLTHELDSVVEQAKKIHALRVKRGV